MSEFIFAQAIDPATVSGFESLLQPLGVFAVVIVVFKFMLGRSDRRDESHSAELTKLVDNLRGELVEERKQHHETRQKLYNALTGRISNNEALISHYHQGDNQQT